MKTIRIIIAAIVMLAIGMNASAQELSKSQKKAIKKEVAAMQKEGWKVKPGSMSLYDQQVRSITAQNEEDDEGMNKWVIGEASSVSDLYDTAKMSAMTIAKNNLVKSVTQRTTVSNDNEMSNDQAKAEGQSYVEEAGKQVTVDVQTLRTKTLMECYRETPDGKVEVRVIVAIPASQAQKINKGK